MFRTLRGIVTKSQSLFQQFSVISYLIGTTSLKYIIPLKHTFKFLSLLLLGASLSLALLASSAMAQKRTTQSMAHEWKEDHASAAMEWLENFTNPMHEARYDSLRQIGYDELRQMDNRPAMKTLSSAAWIEVAKSQGGLVSGRPSGIAFDPTGAIYLATTNGGLWKSTNNGQNWTSLSDNWKTLNVGDVAVNPHNPSTVYAGTGIYLSDVGGGGSLNGVGVYKSVDGGLNWVLLDSTSNSITTQMEINPADTSLIYRATTGGVRMSSDAGMTWKLVASLGGATSLVMDPKNPAVLYAGGGSQIMKSTDSGRTWQTLSGYPTGQLMVLAMSRSSSDTLYLSTGYGKYQTLSASYSTLAISPDQGVTWDTTSSSVQYTGTQAYYDNAIAVNPQNPSNVIVGGLDIYSSTHAGTNLTARTDWLADPGVSNYSHADVHVLKYNPYTNVLFALTDGGIYHSEANGSSWESDMNADLGTMLFVGGDMTTDGAFFCAGAQDNGLNGFTAGQDLSYQSVKGGDGGTMFVSPQDGETTYGTYVEATLYHSADRGQNWNPPTEPADQKDGYNILGSAIVNEGAPFYMIYDVWDGGLGVIAACGNRNLFLETNGNTGVSAFPQVTNVINPLTNKIIPSTAVTGNVVAVNIAASDDDYIYLGTSSGDFYYSTDISNVTWTPALTTKGAKMSFGGVPMGITTDPNNASNVFMVVAGTTSKHFYFSIDNGQTWTAPATNLPAFNYRCVAVDPNGIVYVGHDYGVLRSGDTGKTWYPVADGFPMAMVTSLQVRGNYLAAATYGRGMYYVDLTQLPPLGSSSVASAANPNSSISISAVYPSIITTSAPRSNIDYSIPGGEQATLAVYDIMGREERMLANEFAAQGSHEISADFSGLATGQHYIVLTAGGSSVTKPIIIE